MSNPINTGFLCEWSDTNTPICGRNAIVEIKKTENDPYDGPQSGSTYGCDKHALLMSAGRGAEVIELEAQDDDADLVGPEAYDGDLYGDAISEEYAAGMEYYG